jgi:hypothetical protein
MTQYLTQTVLAQGPPEWLSEVWVQGVLTPVGGG